MGNSFITMAGVCFVRQVISQGRRAASGVSRLHSLVVGVIVQDFSYLLPVSPFWKFLQVKSRPSNVRLPRALDLMIEVIVLDVIAQGREQEQANQKGGCGRTGHLQSAHPSAQKWQFVS